MNARKDALEPTARITLDDLKHRAETVRDIAVSETKAVASRVSAMEATRKALIIAGVVCVVVSLAYMAGTRAGTRPRSSD